MTPQAFFRRVGDAAALGRLFDYLPDVYLFVKDKQHRFTMVNRAMWTLHGCASADQMLGKTDWDFHPPVLAQQYIDEDKRVMRSGRPLPDQIWLVPGADGLPRWYVSSKMPLHGRSKGVIGIAGVMRPYEQAGEAPGEYRRLIPAIDRVLTHYGEPIRIADLATRSNLSTSQFQREFQRMFGLAPREYLAQVRLQAARRRLQISEAPVSEIAHDCGFYDQSYFTKRFKAVFGLRPLQYRRRFSVRPGPKRD